MIMLARYPLLFCSILFVFQFLVSDISAEPVTEERIRTEVIAPYSLGNKTETDGVWELLNGSGSQGGYVIESEWIKPLPGFASAPINLIILIDLEGILIDVKILNHNEPIFVSGLGEAPFRAFIEQYRGQSINSAITIGSSYGKNKSSGSLIYFDGVTKATASVRIAHESIMASAREVAKNLMDGLSTLSEKVTLKTDDPFPNAGDDDPYVDMWIVDVTHPHVARSVMSKRMLKDWESFTKIAPEDETILLIEEGVHGVYTRCRSAYRFKRWRAR